MTRETHCDSVLGIRSSVLSALGALPSAHTKLRAATLVRLARVALSAWSLLAVSASAARSQISPGPLARSHAALEGATNCTKCHGLRRESVSQQCLACHGDIALLLDQGRGLHGREAKNAKRGCASCHPDHAGRDFALIAWPGGTREGFDHNRTGWSLELSHRDVKCETCHTANLRTSSVVAKSQRKREPGWVGLETSCASCHRTDDIHQGSLGRQCESCHDAGKWRAAARFDHATASYPLTGKHVGVSCDKCHLTARLPAKRNERGDRVPVFKPVPFKDCSDCHEDPHRGRMSARCSECHTTTSFAAVDKKQFNHSVTRYPLMGQHSRVPCAGCHGDNLSRPRPAFGTCSACHRDVHAGQATLGGAVADCAACHGVEGFAAVSFTTAQHGATRFPLRGKHLRVPCQACHTSTGSSATGATARMVRIRMPFGRCTDCHSDAHSGQLADREDQGRCEACHVVDGWNPSTYSRAAHEKLRLPLEGRHAQIPCASCHAPTRAGLPDVSRTLSLGTARTVLRLPEWQCVSCHATPHGDRDAGSGASATNAPCTSCHNATSWRPSTVDVASHSQFAFALDGAHRAVACVACHEEMKGSRATSTLVLSSRGMQSLPFAPPRARNCESCHENPHGMQFSARRGGGTCETCHGVERFVPAARFDHNRDVAFSLGGAHAQVACARCHKSEPLPNGSTRVVYRPLSAKCESCHASRPREGT